MAEGAGHNELRTAGPGAPALSLPVPSADTLPAVFPSMRELPPAAARLVLETEKSLVRLGVARGMRLLAAVSGGADSVALACLLSLLKDRLGVTVRLVTCDHGLRPESADEVSYVLALAGLLGLEADAFSLNMGLERAPGTEERARALRYTAMELLRARTSSDWILLGHHAGDLREDVVLRLLRGTGWPGLGGMGEKDGERRLLRPLLYTEPRKLREFLAAIGIPHCEDPSNQDQAYARNRIRHSVLPLLREESQGLDRSLLDLSRLAKADEEYFAEALAPAVESFVYGEEQGALTLTIPMKSLKGLHRALRLRLYLAAVRRLVRLGAAGQARSETLFQLDEALEKKAWPGLFQLPGGMTLFLAKDGVTLAGRIR